MLGGLLKQIGSGILNGFTSNPLGAIGGLFSAFSSIGATKREQRKQKNLMAYQDKLNDENYQQQLADQRQMIAEDRQYNSIGAQMQRARDANVSPLAALGVNGGNSLSARSPSEPGPSIPAANTDSLTAVASSLQSAIMQNEQMQTMRRERELTEQRIATEKLNQVKQRFENIISEIEANGFQEKYNTMLAQLKEDLRKATADANQSELDYDFALDSYQTRLNQLGADVNLKNSSAELNRESAKDLKETRASRIADKTASARESNAIARSEDAFRDLRKSILSHESEKERYEKISALSNSIVDAWTAYYVQVYGEQPPKNQTDSVIGLLKRVLFGSDKETSRILTYANSDIGLVGFLANVLTLDSGDPPRSFLDWYKSLTR